MAIKHMMQVAEVSLMYKSIKDVANTKIQSSADTETLIRPYYSIDTIEYKESFYAMYMNRANKVLAVSHISQGGRAGTVVDISEILTTALLINASALILSHNHPSGSLDPSLSDLEITMKAKTAGEILGINVLDHIILTADAYYSMADNGTL